VDGRLFVPVVEPGGASARPDRPRGQPDADPDRQLLRPGHRCGPPGVHLQPRILLVAVVQLPDPRALLIAPPSAARSTGTRVPPRCCRSLLFRHFLVQRRALADGGRFRHTTIDGVDPDPREGRPMPTLLLNEDDVHRLLTMGMALEAVEQGLRKM